eukprot:1161266-Pelagomonas_calceolata.AAC.2
MCELVPAGVAITMCVFFFQQLIKTLWGMFRACSVHPHAPIKCLCANGVLCAYPVLGASHVLVL